MQHKSSSFICLLLFTIFLVTRLCDTLVTLLVAEVRRSEEGCWCAGQTRAQATSSSQCRCPNSRVRNFPKIIQILQNRTQSFVTHAYTIRIDSDHNILYSSEYRFYICYASLLWDVGEMIFRFNIYISLVCDNRRADTM